MKSDDRYFELGYRSLLAKVLYDVGELESLEAAINNYLAYLRRNRKKFSEQYLNSHFNRIYLFRDLLKIERKIDKVQQYIALLELHEKIEATLHIDDRKWLLNKVESRLKELKRYEKPARRFIDELAS